jgi:hypothetical protein
MIKLLLAAFLLVPTTQAPPPPLCLDRTDVNEITVFLLPIALDSLADKCRSALPANAFLLNGGHVLSLRLASEGSAHWRGVMAAIAKLGGERVPAGISQATSAQVFREMMRGEVIDKLKPADCADVNEAAELLAPLPPENIGGLVRLLIRASGADRQPGKREDIRICANPAP